MKCEICSAKIQKIFLGKILGTQVKDAKGKKHYICHDCQSKIKTKPEILEKLK